MTDGPPGRATEHAPGTDADGRPVDEWPVEWGGITETVVATLGPNDRYNHAALGLHAGTPATAQTWGRTRTRRNFEARGEAFVQFIHDPLAFVEAALGIYETESPLLPAATAWCRVTVEEIDRGSDGDTEWREWQLMPVEGATESHSVPYTSRAYGAIIEATVAASRLDVPEYDKQRLLDRLAHCESVVERCGSDREHDAFERLSSLTSWREQVAERS